MIDVVFLLLVFFMLAARFGQDLYLPLSVAGSSDGAPYQGPPRLVEITQSTVFLNGTAVDLEALPDRLSELTERSDQTIVLQARDDAPLQRLVSVLELLRSAGFTGLVLVE